MAGAKRVPFQGPKKSRFSGPTPSNAPRNDVAPLKTITYRAIKTTGTLIVTIYLWVIPSKEKSLMLVYLYLYCPSSKIQKQYGKF
jgi:hypothetical protein